MAEKKYRTVTGVVQFEPRESETKDGTEIRNITVRQTGFKENAIRVGATLWPSHSHVEVEKGDFVVLEGSYSQNKGENSDGERITYHNLSVSAILNLGQVDFGVRDDDDDEDEKPKKKRASKKTTSKKKQVEEDDDEDEDDDEIPF